MGLFRRVEWSVATRRFDGPSVIFLARDALLTMTAVWLSKVEKQTLYAVDATKYLFLKQFHLHPHSRIRRKPCSFQQILFLYCI